MPSHHDPHLPAAPTSQPRSACRRRLALVTALVLVTLSLSACAASANVSVGGGPRSGFLMGLWHGAISPITFVVSLFNADVAMYEVRNSGHWYDLGFLLGCSIALSGAARSRWGSGSVTPSAPARPREPQQERGTGSR